MDIRIASLEVFSRKLEFQDYKISELFIFNLQ